MRSFWFYLALACIAAAMWAPFWLQVVMALAAVAYLQMDAEDCLPYHPNSVTGMLAEAVRKTARLIGRG